MHPVTESHVISQVITGNLGYCYTTIVMIIIIKIIIIITINTEVMSWVGWKEKSVGSQLYQHHIYCIYLCTENIKWMRFLSHSDSFTRISSGDNIARVTCQTVSKFCGWGTLYAGKGIPAWQDLLITLIALLFFSTFFFFFF